MRLPSHEAAVSIMSTNNVYAEIRLESSGAQGKLLKYNGHVADGETPRKDPREAE
jgi:hypothetical protein